MPYDPEVHGPRRIIGPGFHTRVYALVQRIPRGRVTTFGDVAGALGLRSAARQVGYALAALPSSRGDVPWYRVVNAAGRLPVRADGIPSPVQAGHLRAEGIDVQADGKLGGFKQLRYHFPE